MTADPRPKGRIETLAGFVGLAWAVYFANAIFFGGRLIALGIVPHNVIGLRGILFAPFLHGSLAHLAANTAPFLVLGWLVMLRRTGDFYTVSAAAMLSAGLGTWVFGAPGSLHIGASGVIFGYLGFLLARGYFERSLRAVLLSVAVGFLYGGMIWGVLPGQPMVSWQGHLFGFIGGIAAARSLRR